MSMPRDLKGSEKFNAHVKHSGMELTIDGKIDAYWCKKCGRYHTKRYYCSASAINKWKQCKAMWWHKYVRKSRVLTPGRRVFLNTGLRCHKIEEGFWKFVIRRNKPIMDLDKISNLDAMAIGDYLTHLKTNMMFRGEPQVYHDYIRNLSYIDAIEFLKLVDFFDGDAIRAYKYWIPVECEFRQVNVDLRHRIIIDYIKIIPANFLQNKQDVLCIGDYKPGKFDKNGNPRSIRSISKYDYGNFKRQMKIYAYTLKYPIEDPMKVMYLEVKMYKTGQMIREKAPMSFGWIEKDLSKFWNCDEFPRKFGRHCSWCDYRLQCLSTYQLMVKRNEGKAYRI